MVPFFVVSLRNFLFAVTCFCSSPSFANQPLPSSRLDMEWNGHYTAANTPPLFTPPFFLQINSKALSALFQVPALHSRPPSTLFPIFRARSLPLSRFLRNLWFGSRRRDAGFASTPTSLFRFGWSPWPSAFAASTARATLEMLSSSFLSLNPNCCQRRYGGYFWQFWIHVVANIRLENNLSTFKICGFGF